MANKYKMMSKLIVKKTGAFYKFSIVLLVFSLLLLASGGIFVARQYAEWDRNFMSNDKTHVIAVTKKQERQPLTFADDEALKKLVGKSCKADVYAEYMLECGFYHDRYGDIFVHSLSGQNKALLGLSELNDKVSYSNVDFHEPLKIQIPVVDVKAGGFTASKSVPFSLGITKPLGTNPVAHLFEETNDKEVYVPLEQFKQIVCTMFTTDWKGFKQKYDSGNPFAMNVIKGYYVYVDEIDDVNHCAALLKENGYHVNYTIKAFDDVSASVRMMEIVIALFIVMFYVISYIVVYISINSYYRMQSRDIGILKQMGFSRQTLNRIYFGIVKKPLMGIFFLLVIFIIGMGILFVENGYLILAVLLSILLLYLIMIVSIKSLVHRIIEKPMLELLKEKEFE